MWLLWVFVGLAVWLVVASVVGVILGRSMALADRIAAGGSPEPVSVSRAPATAARRGSPPLPTFAVVLAAVALVFETTGFMVRLTGASGPTASLLSMDAPFSLPRLYVAALFAAAALAAVAGAGSIPGRRTWWLAVGLVAGTIAAVKAGSTVHVIAVGALTDRMGFAGALAVSALAAASVAGALWFLSRTERRDRRRVIGVLSLYAVASVGLSAVSAAAGSAFGHASSWAAGATFVEESGEALAGVSFLFAVLVGVAPRVALPAAWALRRSADAHTLELPEHLPERVADGHARG